MLKLMRFLKNYKKEVFLGPLFKLTEAVFELIVPLVMIKIIDVGIKNADVNYVLKMGGVMLALGVIGLLCSLTCQYFASKASQGFGTEVRNELFSHINSLSHAEIDEMTTATLITRINNDVNQLQVGVAMLIRLAIRSPFLVVGATAMAMLLDFKLSLIFLIAAPLIALVLYFVTAKSIPIFKKIQKGLDRISLITRENLSGTRVIRAFATQEREKARFDAANEEFTKANVQVGKLSALLNPCTTVLINAAIIAIIWFGGIRVDGGTFTQGEIIALVNYLTQILIALIALAQLVVIFTKAIASASRVNEVFDLHSSIIQKANAQAGSIAANAPIIEFSDVSFSYGKSTETALQDISFKVNKHETIGIIGATGSGKSTIINLMPRFFDVQKGEVLVNGINVKDYQIPQLRKMFSLVPQKAVLFSGTLRENMKWGNELATDADIAAAIKTAQANDFVNKFPNGYDEPIMQEGKNLSGGQKQRLTIARALIAKPQILILDDSASALDLATDAALRNALAKDLDEMTVIIVSQRVSTVKTADRILCLDDGRLAGIGTHEELLACCDEYREICNAAY